MSPVPATVSMTASRASWWSKIANSANSNDDSEQPSRIDAEDLSDHMLRDIGMLDGRPMRGERQGQGDLNSLLDDYAKRSL